MSKWQKTISLGESLAIAANLGVIVGLVLVWMELRQSQTQLAADVELSLAASYQTAIGRMIDNEQVRETMRTSYLDPDSLTMDQYGQLMGVHAEYMSFVYATYELWRSGAISEDTWLLHSNYYLHLLRTEWLQDFWREIHHEGYPDEFMDSLESRMMVPEVWQAPD